MDLRIVYRKKKRITFIFVDAALHTSGVHYLHHVTDLLIPHCIAQ